MIKSEHVENGSTWVGMMLNGVNIFSGTAQRSVEINYPEFYAMATWTCVSGDTVKMEMIRYENP